jgi:HEAT repeat protein
MFRGIRISLFVLASLSVSLLPVYGWETESEHLAKLQDEDASYFEKSNACKRLAVVGTETAVPVLADLLGDEKLAHLARYALEPNPSPEVDLVFLASLKTLKGKMLVGVINSIANRGKVDSLVPLSKLMAVDDSRVAAAAAHAIARLGTPQAAKILGKSKPEQFAAACLVCGKTLAAQGHESEAVNLLKQLVIFTKADEHVRTAAMLQLVKLQGAEGQERLAAALRSKDLDMFNMALRTARLLPQKTALPTVVEVIRDASPARAALLITLLGDLDDPDGLSVVMQAIRSNHAVVQIAALEALAKLGTADHVAMLVDTATTGPTDVAEQADDTLAQLRGPKVDQAVLEMMDNEARRPTVIRAIGRRRITEAVPNLLTLIDGPHQLEVVAALGETVSLDQLNVLAKLINVKSPELRGAAQQAIHAACDRMPNRDAASEELSQYLSDDTAEFVMNELRLIGGDKALQIVTQAAEGNGAVLKEYATRSMGEWLDVSVSPALLKLAKDEGGGKYGIRAIKGYIRIARQFTLPEAKRMAMCRTALSVATRTSEQRLVLTVLERNPSVAALRIAVVASKKPALRKFAKQSAQRIAAKLGVSQEVEKLLGQIPG